MTLQRFLTEVADSRWFWLGLRQWQPGADRPWAWSATLAHAVRMEVVSATLGLALLAVTWRTSMRGSFWPLEAALTLGLVGALMMVGTVAVAWNRRWAQHSRNAAPPLPPLPPLRLWQRWVLGPIYALLLFVLTPFYLWFAADNALGAWAWQRARAGMLARGVPLTPQQLASPLPPEDENLAMTPLLRPLLDYRLVVTNRRTDALWADAPGYHRAQAFGVLPQIIEPARPAGSSGRARTTNDGRYDLIALARGIRAQPLRAKPGGLAPEIAARYGVATNATPAMTVEKARALAIPNPAAEVLDFLKRYEPEMREIEAAAQRPESRFPVHWDEGQETLLPHLGPVKGLSSLFRTRAAARLAQGDAAGAFADTLTVLRLGRAVAGEPLLVSQLVHLAQRQIGLAAVWEGLVARRWNDAQIAELQAFLSQIDPRGAMLLAYQGERIFMNRSFEGMLVDPASFALVDASQGEQSGSPVPPTATRRSFPGLRPVGILRRNQVASNRLYDDLVAQVLDPSWPSTLAGVSTKDPDAALLRRTGLTPISPHTLLAAQLAPAVSRAHAKGARLLASTRLGEVACALERFRLASGKYPETLDELVPRQLTSVPLDPMNRQPLKYQRNDDGGYRMWSVGLNGRDDGGVMKLSQDDRLGDWVWPEPVPSAEPRLFR